MSFNVTANDAKFIVNEEKKTVVCVIEHTEDLFRDFVYENFHISPECDHCNNWMNGRFRQSSYLYNRLQMPNKFVGVARCGADDEWDEKIGRVIAFTRAKDSLLTSFYKRGQTYVTTINNWLNEAVDILNALGQKLEVNKQKRHDYITSLVGEEPPEEA